MSLLCFFLAFLPPGIGETRVAGLCVYAGLSGLAVALGLIARRSEATDYRVLGYVTLCLVAGVIAATLYVLYVTRAEVWAFWIG